MSYPITDVIGLTPLTVASASYTPDLSSLPTTTNDDYVVLCVISSATLGTISISGTGWAEQIELDVGAGARMGVYYCKVASGTVATPTISLSTGTSSWQCAAWIERDADGTNLFDGSVSYDPASNVTSLASAAYTPATNDCRIIWFAAARASGSTPNMRMLETDAVGELFQSSYDGSIGTCIIIGSAVQDTAASTVKTAYRNATGRTGIITLGVKNKSGGKRAQSATAGLSRVSWCGAFGDSHDGALTPVRSSRGAPASRTINSIAVSTTAATFTADASGPGVWGSWDQYATAVNGGWQGTMFTYSADIDMTGKLFTVEFFAAIANIFNNEGLIVVFEDSGGTNWNAYQLTKNYGWRANYLYTSIIDIANQTPYDSGGMLDLTQVRMISFLVHRLANTTSRSFYVRHLNLLSKTTLTGGNSSYPQTINYLRKALQGWSCDRLVGGDAPAVTLKSDVQIGDGTTPTYFDATGTLLAFPAAFDPSLQREWKVGANQVDVSVYAGSTDTINLTANTLATSFAQNLTIDASSSTSAAHSEVGASIVGPWDVTWKTGVACTGATFSGCDEVNFKGASVTGCTIIDTVSTDAAIAFDSSGAIITNSTIDVTGTSATYHLVLGTSVTAITLTDVTFTGTPATNKVHVLKTTGTVTITISGTTSLVAVDVTSDGALVSIDAPIITATGQIVGLVTGSRVQIYNVTASTEIYNDIVAGTSWSDSYITGTDFSADDVVRVRVAWMSGVTAKLPATYTTIATADGWAVLATQEDDEIYNLNAIDGDTVTEFVADYPHVQIDVDDADGATTPQRGYAWYIAGQMTADGIAYYHGAMTAEDVGNYRINVDTLDLKLQNISASPVFITGARLYRSDGSRVTDTGTGNIEMEYGRVFTTTISTSDAVISGTAAEIIAVIPAASEVATAVWAKTLP